MRADPTAAELLARPPAKADERPSKSATEGAKRDAVSLGTPLRQTHFLREDVFHKTYFELYLHLLLEYSSNV